MLQYTFLVMSVSVDPAMPSEAMVAIHTRQREQFRHLTLNGIKKSFLDDFEAFLATPGTLSRPSLIVRCRISAQDLTFRVVVDKPISRPRLTQSLLPSLRRTLHRIHQPADFFVLLSDSVYVSPANRARFLQFLKGAPLLRCDRRDDDDISSHSVLIPDFGILGPKYADELVAIARASDAIAFEQRLSVIKWRGTLSGPGYPNLDNRRDFARYALLMASLRHPDVLDARLITYDNMTDSESAVALQLHLREMFGDPAEELPAESFVRHKYLISLDGAVAAWKRVPTILASRSVLLLQHQWSQFFYPGLKPWVHYAPVRHDISDLTEVHRWLVDHPAQARTIADNGQRFAREILHPTVLETFFVQVVNRCGELYSAD
ncbi:glycosyl transferase family 90 [Streptosporangium sp. CA-115845]|uniref:glycosyl transferase family 90 n=1 Tax=Streptosporangium sp. CA-115845 TaxID=3240071 RepID=UPI003D8BAD76